MLCHTLSGPTLTVPWTTAVPNEEAVEWHHFRDAELGLTHFLLAMLTSSNQINPYPTLQTVNTRILNSQAVAALFLFTLRSLTYTVLPSLLPWLCFCWYLCGCCGGTPSDCEVCHDAYSVGACIGKISHSFKKFQAGHWIAIVYTWQYTLHAISSSRHVWQPVKVVCAVYLCACIH